MHRFSKVGLLSIPAIVALLAITGFFAHARNSIDDLLFSARPAPDLVTIITIDEQSIHTIGQWPWPRTVMASAIQRLQRARVIGIDVNYKEPSRVGSADDAVFADTLRHSQVPVVLTSELEGATLHSPISILASASYQGLANVPVESDGTVRFAILDRSDSVEPSFAEAIITHAGYPATHLGTQRIRYYGPGSTIANYPFTDLLANRIPRSQIDGHIILIGATARDLQDYRQTPFGLTSGVEIQATIVTNAIADEFIHSAPLADIVGILLVGIIVLISGSMIRNLVINAAAIGSLIILYWSAASILFARGFLLDPFYPTISALLCTAATVIVRYLAASRERKFIHDTFSRYLAPQVITELIRDPSRIRLGGQKQTLTILFSDIRSFTTLSEQLGPEELIRFLNHYLSAMTEIILEHRGVVDKYIGDAIMAFWGAPMTDTEHADNAITAALGMAEALTHVNTENREHSMPEIAIGIGLNTGDVTVGNVGSERRFDYTVIGDTVNLASRLEGLTKTYGVCIIASEYVREAITPEHRACFREIDRVKVKGKNKPVTIFEVMPPTIASRIVPVRSQFDEGRAAYYAGRWNDAQHAFDQVLETVPTDGPSRTLRERCTELASNPPADWDGAYTLSHK